MLLHVFICDPIWQNESLSRTLPNDNWENGVEMNSFSIYFILIQLCGIFQKCTNCLFELQMPFSQNDAISDLIFFLSLSSHICRVKHATGNFV